MFCFYIRRNISTSAQRHLDASDRIRRASVWARGHEPTGTSDANGWLWNRPCDAVLHLQIRAAIAAAAPRPADTGYNVATCTNHEKWEDYCLCVFLRAKINFREFGLVIKRNKEQTRLPVTGTLWNNSRHLVSGGSTLFQFKGSRCAALERRIQPDGTEIISEMQKANPQIVLFHSFKPLWARQVEMSGVFWGESKQVKSLFIWYQITGNVNSRPFTYRTGLGLIHF